MKKTLKYTLFLVLVSICALLDSCFFKNIRLSLLLCICFSLYKRTHTAIVIGAFCGLLCDLLSLTLPYFSCTYLYISVGCVWCREMFLGFNTKWLYLIGFLAYFSHFLLCYIVNAISYADFFVSFQSIIEILASAIIITSIAPIIHFVFKRLRF